MFLFSGDHFVSDWVFSAFQAFCPLSLLLWAPLSHWMTPHLPFVSASLSFFPPHKDYQFSNPSRPLWCFSATFHALTLRADFSGPSGYCILQEFYFPCCCCWCNHHVPECCLCPLRTSWAVSLIVQPENSSGVLEGGAGRQPHMPSISLEAFIMDDNREKNLTLGSASVFRRNILPVRNICPASAWWRSLSRPQLVPPIPPSPQEAFCCPAWTTAQHENS